MKKLSSIQSRVLAELAWNARVTIPEVAKKLRVKPHTVRYAVDHLKRQLNLEPVCFTDPYRQGLTPFRVYFSTNSSDASVTKRLVDCIKGRAEVQWFSALLGRYQFGMSIRASSIARLEALLVELDRDCPGIVSEKSISVLSHISFFIPWLAHSGNGPRKSFSYQAGVEVCPLDRVDKDILHELRQDPIASVERIGKATRISPSTIAYRLQKMLESGVIVGFCNSCDSRSLQLESHLLFISTKGLGGGCYERFFHAASLHPRVVWVGRTIGSWDLEMEVKVQSPSEVDDVMRLVHEIGQGGVTKVTTHTWGQSHRW